MQERKGSAMPHIPPVRLFIPGLRVMAPACILLLVVGCAHQTAERTPASQKSPVMEKQASPAATQPSRMEQPDKAKTVEKKSRDKKSTTSTDSTPDKKMEQPEEASADTFVPPPPLRPPTFGGAGG